MREPVFGIVLCGGRSSRMGCVDKAFRLLGGETLLARVIRAFRPQCEGVLLSAHPGNAARAAELALPVVTDGMAGFAGPLAGILAGLEWVADHRPDTCHLAIAAVDTPFLPVDLVERLGQALAPGDALLACAASGGRTHPICGLWPVSLRGDLRDAVERGARRVHDFVGSYPAAAVPWATEPFDPFFNVNSPEDLERAERILSERALGRP